MLKGIWRTAIVGLCAGTLLLPAPGGGRAPERATQTRDFPVISTLSVRPTRDFGRTDKRKDDRRLATTWQVVPSTGNCCENYLTTTANETLIDFGGDFIRYSEPSADGYQRWKEVLSDLSVSAGGEGAVALAPGGDVVGVGWYPYTGDRLTAYKYDAAAKQWLANDVPVHTPFFDREWIVALPGRFELPNADRLGETPELPNADRLGETPEQTDIESSYITIVKGGWPSKELWYMSFDGLTYVPMGSKQTQGDAQPHSGPLKVAKDPSLDAYQPNSNTGITALGNGGALAGWDSPGFTGWWILDPTTFTWRKHTFPGDQPTGRIQADSLGRLHEVAFEKDATVMVWRTSKDGGESWSTRRTSLPRDFQMEEYDFRAHGKLGVGAVAVHGHDFASDTDRDFVYRVDIRAIKPRLRRVYEAGLGDRNASAGVTSSIARFDFATVVILSDGRIATSVLDSSTGGEPGILIERSSART